MAVTALTSLSTSPSVTFSSPGMPVTKPTSKSWWAPIHLEPQPTEAQAYIPALPAELGANPRKPWGDAKECQKMYCKDHRDLWCTACQQFLD